jgi:hypothetical protein
MRVFFVGFRADEDKVWVPPAETHSADALLLSQWASREYWERHKVAMRHRPPQPEGIEKKIRALVDADYGANLLAWKTVRDTICDPPDPATGGVGVGGVEDGFGAQHRVELVRDVFQLVGDLLEAEADFLGGAGSSPASAATMRPVRVRSSASRRLVERSSFGVSPSCALRFVV